jgi:nitroreductase
MELYEAMRSTFSAREFTNELIPDEVLYRILDNARFASSGGNRQGWRVLVVSDPHVREEFGRMTEPAVCRYVTQVAAGENPWNTIHTSNVDEQALAATQLPDTLTDIYARAAVVLVVCVDLSVIASTDQYLDRVGVISGASIYPFVWNILLAARAEGYGGVLTTFLPATEPAAKALLKLPDEFAIAAALPLGRPLKPLTRLNRRAVETFARRETWDGVPFEMDD